MASTSTELGDIQALATRMAALAPRESDQLALVGLMAGALYALARAAQCNFDDARMRIKFSDELSELAQTLDAIQRGTPPGEPWLSGFYLVSALMRLAALNERVGRYLGTRRDTTKEVRVLVNQIKHDVDAGITRGWSITFAEVLASAEALCALLEQAIV